MIELSIVIPAYNEAHRITPTLHDYLEYYRATNSEIIVVLNGCSDGTLAIVKSFAERFPQQLRWINLEQAAGKGGAVQAGLLAAVGNYRGFVDADESTTPPEFQKLVDRLREEGTDAVIASRWIKGAIIRNRDSLWRKLASKLFVFIVHHRFHMPFYDTQCGAKVFTSELVQAIVPQLQITNMTFDVELLYRALQRGYGIIEVPTIWVDKTSSAMFNSPIQLLRKGIRMYFSLFRIHT
ncbi:MAG: glycosyltransferase family 2 protein [Candidatus Kerfeldbacteria bacterium]|nr:glycosyltransferase family 2 protein [Candidatus Kerfeldbacteria bacterium]